ncbi:hypothetical protein POPTR_002G185700v4 [Populus trichocarpa]|uniref:Fold protein n=1 Tax=Populus trichocarpa TaxID=3694 RepID=B9GRW5_POPTR|nr:uncharacterized protein LOC7478830 [Populus trichocarpa]PNT50420.1 hypothetical protein POPTR_002G185700v4 [Populus trichocarpa]|eukprot:XP_002302701.2 uncharacterized protein LOC7478830 [Populus trichocarpa]
MASDASMATLSSSVQEDDQYDHDHDTDDGYHPPSLHNLSRLSMCTSSMYTNEDDDYQDCDGMTMFASRLTIESFDADEELSDDQKEGNHKNILHLSSDSDKETGCYSLPATPPRWRNRGGPRNQVQLIGVTDYASENEAQKGIMRQKMRKNLRKRRVIRERRMDNSNTSFKKKEEEITGLSNYGSCNSFSGESEGGGLVVITRPKGGRRSLCMDLEEVKACRDLGFELEHERMLELPSSRVSLSGSTLDTSSGGDSPIANWRISSPGDDPRDVKARLKVWAQAVAVASASRHGGI